MASASFNSDPSKFPADPGQDAGAADRGAVFRIVADGTWFFRGSAIQRPEMVKLFASVLRREGDGYMLVTPYERHTVIVDDAPFVAVAMRRDPSGAESAGALQDERCVAQRLILTTNIGHEVVVSPEHPLIVRGTRDAPRPYVMLESGIEALVSRAVYYEFAALAEAGADGRLGMWSGGAFFALEPANETT